MREGYGTCPVCQGTKLLELAPADFRFSWNAGKTHRACDNCGGQYQWPKATGEAKLRPDGTPCTHEYQSVTESRCYHRITCKACQDLYYIDSGD